MTLQKQLDPAQLAQARSQVDNYNAKLKARGIKTDKDMGQDKYLKLLVTQLKYQDPSNPLKNHQFAAQMAQFSALEQMTKMNSAMDKMLVSTRSAENYQLLGKNIEWIDGATKQLRRGSVSAIGFENGKPVVYSGKTPVAPQDIVQVELPGKN